MSEFLKSEMFDVFQPASLKRKTLDSTEINEINQNNGSNAKKKIKNENNSQFIPNPMNPMKNLEEKMKDHEKEIPPEKAQNNVTIEIEEEEKDAEIKKELDLKEKELQKKYMIEKFDIDITTEDFGCLHEIIAPKGFQRKAKKQNPPAKEYPFVLDPFQKTAIECLEQYESVLVAAHTSAGKTAVAEYAIAMALRDKQRVIYTSPIKALSNQKYRELNNEFGDVGLITGDVSINQNASCLVMTTEIFRSMLYRGSEIIREVAWVIFDEVHYMRDKERGVVWEETIILTSPNIKYVFLSATIPNAREFAEWICTIKKQVCHVVYTDFRPVPLQHYLFPTGGEGIYLVVDETGKFREDNFNKALAVLGEGVEMSIGDKRKKKKPTEGADLFKIVKMIMEKKFDPVIIFSFSKKEVEGYAMAMTKLDLTTEEEKENIEKIYESAMDCLSEEDKTLPQIQLMLPILKKGIGIHHGGLLPIVKEVIEILFQEGYIKALFSTETFSMGLNMPAKTVVFTTIRKFDGENFRWIGGGEYIQMSGRAGRRGKDDRGMTILMIDEKMEPDVAKNILKGCSDPLNSSFHLNYNMLLNSMRIEDTDPEYIIRRSFHQFQNDKALPEMRKKLKELQNEKKQIKIDKEKIISEVFEINSQIKQYQDKIKKIICKPEYMLPYLSIGRLVFVKKGEDEWGWGISINFTQKKLTFQNKQKNNAPLPSEQMYIVDVMLHIKPKNKNEEPSPASIDEEGVMEVIPMLLENIYELSSIRIELPDDLTRKENKALVKETMKEIKKQFSNNIPVINKKEMKIENLELDKLIEKKEKYQKEKENIVKDIPLTSLEKNLKIFEKKQKLNKTINLLQSQIENSEKMVLEDDLKCMKRVLRRLEFTNKYDIVQIKGKVACDISACDEILITELMFAGLFNEMESNEIAGLLSALVHDESPNAEKTNIAQESLAKFYGVLLEHGRRIVKVYNESKINIDENEYLNGIKPQLADITFSWCNGANFGEICKNTDAFEGSIIRCMRRLDEMLKQLSDASKTIGNIELEKKFTEASKLLKRGIVFAGSLYLKILSSFKTPPFPMQVEALKKIDGPLFKEFEDIYLSKYKKMEYGTAGFRTKNAFLDLISFRTGIIVSLLSRLDTTKALGLMITASHNPIEDNGVKITDFDGGMLRGHLEKELENFVNEKNLEKAIENLLLYLEKMEAGKKIDLNEEGTSFLGGDTRPSTERLLKLASEGIVLGGGIVKNFGECTTPMLHFFVNFFNGRENQNYSRFSLKSPSKEIFEIYHEYFGSIFNRIIECTPSANVEKLKSSHILLDCANGIGGRMTERFLQTNLKGLLNVEIINKDDLGNLNNKCGAEYVQKDQDYPLNSKARLAVYQEKKLKVRCVSYDGDADRIVYYLPTEKLDKIRLLDGDKIMSLFAVFFTKCLTEIQSLQKQLSSEGVKISEHDFSSWKIGAVQTAYANGASTNFLKNGLGLEVKIRPTGVKHLHAAAHHFDIGIYFEANGHGTLLYKLNRIDELQHFINQLKAYDVLELQETHKEAYKRLESVANQMLLVLLLSNQAVGDAQAVFFMIEAILMILNMEPEEWENFYRDLPNKTTKVYVKSKQNVVNTEDQTRCVEPKDLQDTIDEIVKSIPKGRSFVRPSGTEDVLRIYAEAETMEQTLEISKKVTEAIMKHPLLN